MHASLEPRRNTAGRLYELLSKVKSQKHSQPTATAWANVFSIPVPGNLSEPQTSARLAVIYDLLAGLNQMLKKLEKQVREAKPSNADFYMAEFPKLRLAICPPALLRPFSEVLPQITDTALNSLGILATELPEEGEIEPDELEGFKKDISELFADIRESKTIDDELIKWLLLLLSSMEESINNYWIYGADGLADTFAQVLGKIGSHLGAFNKVKEDDNSVWSKVVKVLNKLNFLAQKAEQYQPLLKYGAVGIDKFLLS